MKYEFARGTEPGNYVAAIRDRFENYKQFVEKDALDVEADVEVDADADDEVAGN